MAPHDLLPYWEQCVSTVDIVDVYRQMGGKLHRHSFGKCMRCGNDTLYLNKDWHSFRCLNLLCNDHGDVVSLIQRTGELSFSYAFAILDSGRCRQRWSIDEIEQFGAVRDCMTAATVFCVGLFPKVEDYVDGLGISKRLAQQFLIGAGRGKQLLKNHLLEEGFSLETIRLTGLLDGNDEYRFHDHVVVPLRQYGQVFDFYGRCVRNKAQPGMDGFLPEDRLAVGRGYFNWNSNRQQVVCVQGVFDALSLFYNGIENVIATGADKVLDATRLRGTSIRRVWLCASTDEADRERVMGTAHGCLEEGVDVRIIEMPDGLCPNDFFLTHSAADFTLMSVNAKTLDQWQADHS
jgi:DNA primase